MLTHRSLITALHNAAMAYDVKADDRRCVLPDVPRRRVPRHAQPHGRWRQVLLMRAYDPERSCDLVDEHGMTRPGWPRR